MEQDTLSISVNWSDRNESMECTATVIKPFLPVTKSQVFLVNVHPAPNGIPSPIILKVFDPRFIEDRVSRSGDHPWSLQNEVAAAERRAAVIRGDREDDYDEDNFLDFGGVLWEDCDRYKVTVSHGAMASDPDIERPVVPSALLLEYILGGALTSVDPRTTLRVLARTLITIVHAIGVYGVIHNDLHADNIIFSPAKPETPSKVYVIDFGHAGLREDESDAVGTRGPGFQSTAPGNISECAWCDCLESLGGGKGKALVPSFRGAMGWTGGCEADRADTVETADEVTAWLDARDAGLLVGAAPPRPGSPDFISLSREEETQN